MSTSHGDSVSESGSCGKRLVCSGLCALQFTKVDPLSSNNLLSAAYQLTVKTTNTWIGFTRDNSNPPWGWSLYNGANATNLNCGAVGCGAWDPSEPTYVLLCAPCACPTYSCACRGCGASRHHLPLCALAEILEILKTEWRCIACTLAGSWMLEGAS